MPYAQGTIYWIGSKSPSIPHDYRDDEQSIDATKTLEEACTNERKGAILYGPPGTGKTTVLARFARPMLDQRLPSITRRVRAPWLDRKAIWSTVAEYVEDVKSEINLSRRSDFGDFGDTYSASGISRSTELLYLDDLGAESDTEYSRSTVESLIDARYRAQDERSTWFTTNYQLSELERRYSSRTLSRLCEMCELIPYSGSDRRIAKAMSRRAG